MLSIGAMGGQSGNYYLDLASEDYYLKGGEPPGVWLGTGSNLLGLSGTVSREEFLNLFNGFSPDGKTKLTQNAGQESHHPGWDLTFSAPKSVSVLWSQSDFDTRKAIQEAHHEAMKAAIAYLEDNALYTKRSHGGIEREKANGLIVATFEHGTSRAQDPQLHTHALVMNVATRFDGSTGTIVGKPYFEHKMTAGAIYRAELAARLEQTLGVSIERNKNLFEILAVPKTLIEFFSTRRHEILEAMDARGVHGPKAAAAATLVTRHVKAHVAREELFQAWQEVGIKHQFTKGHAHALLSRPKEHALDPDTLRSFVNEALESLTKQQSYFTEKALIRTLAEEAPGRGVTAKKILGLARDYLDNSPDIIRLGNLDGQKYYTTKELLQTEARMLTQAKDSSESSSHVIDLSSIEKSLTKVMEKFGYKPSDEQLAALGHITIRPGAIQVVSGMAGTGKTAMLFAAREAWENEDYKVMGAALAGKAARGLEESAEIKSSTIAKLLMGLDTPMQITEEELKKKKFSSPYAKQAYIDKVNASRAKELPRLDSKTILVLDEAGMVDTRQMAELVRRTTEAGAKLVLVGDEKQLQPIETGGSFKALGKTLGRAELTQIQRQKEQWARDAVHDVAFGKSQEALRAFASRGLLTVSANREEAMQTLIQEWKQQGISRPEESLIICGTRLEATILNRKAQAERLAAGKLELTSTRLNGETFHVGDRVLFLENSNKLGVDNGTTGTLAAIEPSSAKQKLAVQLDNGSVTIIDTAKYDKLQLGYAITTHKGQGETVDRAFILVGGSMQDRELSYVQISRAKLKTHIYTDRLEAGDNLSALTEQMERSRQKELALDLARRIELQRMPPDHTL